MATEQRNPLTVFVSKLDAQAPALAQSLEGTGISAQRFIRAAKAAIRRNRDLAATDFNSFYIACEEACRDGMLPDGVEGVILAFKTTAKWIPMVQGKLRQFRRSGQFKWIDADVVREHDTFVHYVDETGPHFRHDPHDDGTGKVLKVYAAATSLDGGFFLQVLSMKDVERARNMSRAKGEDTPWQKWPEEMAKKTALHRLAKFLPSARDSVEDEADEEIAALEAVPQEMPRPRVVPSAKALEEFGSQREGQSTGESAAIVESAVEDGAARDSAPSGDQQHFASPEAYFEYAQGMIDQMLQDSNDDPKQARLWFNSEFQRKLRREHGISVEAVVQFHERNFGK
jgi:phage RecT family recombinase